MDYIPYEEFFDKETNKEFIESFEGLQSKELNLEDNLYLVKNNKSKDYYAVLEAEHGGDYELIEKTLCSWLGVNGVELEKIKPLFPDWYATHELYLIKMKSSVAHA
ncbi:MAG TPA: hypothetical protein VK978_02410 [Candidatus Saccharimonadales bacterium]|nr:hypothetical protein [Candidatus Saccharimonadales bacterium]